MKWITLPTLCLLVAFLIIGPESTIKAADYDRKFVEVFGLDNALPSGNARSPIRSGTNDSWVKVNSKNNQPRSSGTNPHQGTDLQAAAGTLVYPILPGKVKSVNHTLTTQLGSVVLQHDIDGDGIFDDVYVRYVHIDPNGNATNGIKVGDTFTVNQSIGTIDIDRGYYGPHLHFQSVNSSASLTYKLYPFYRWVSDWNFGSHMDFISGDVINSSNTMFITAYANTTNTTNVYNVAKIELYYKIGSTGTWKKSTTNFDLAYPNLNRWSINLKTATGATTGSTIYFYLVATRANDPTFSGSYNIGLWPQYYEHPSAPLSSTNANIIAYSYVIQ